MKKTTNKVALDHNRKLSAITQESEEKDDILPDPEILQKYQNIESIKQKKLR